MEVLLYLGGSTSMVLPAYTWIWHRKTGKPTVVVFGRGHYVSLKKWARSAFIGNQIILSAIIQMIAMASASNFECINSARHE